MSTRRGRYSAKGLSAIAAMLSVVDRRTPLSPPPLKAPRSGTSKGMEGNSVNAILESPVIATDVDAENEMIHGFERPDQNMSFKTIEGTETFSRRRSIGDPMAIPVLTGGRVAIRLPYVSDVNPTMPEAVPDTSVHSWRPRQPQLQESPKSSLVEEFDVLYETYGRRVYRQCLRMLGNREDAEDLTQEVFLQLYRKADTFRGEASFSTWLHRLTVNTVLMQIRRQRRWRSDVTSLDGPAASEDGSNDVAAVAGRLAAPSESPIDKISLEVALSQLSSGYKEIFLMHDLEGYRHDEIAILLGISEGTSKSQLHKARLRLRDLMGGSGARNGAASVVQSARKKDCHAIHEAECVLV